MNQKDNSGEKIFVCEKNYLTPRHSETSLPEGNNSPSSLKGWQTKSDEVVDFFIIKDCPIYKRYTKVLPYNQNLKNRAKELRKAGNLSEVLFWQRLNQGKFWNIDFDRQRIIGNYIVDFYVKSLSLVIEIDGSSHKGKTEYDKERQHYLESFGLKVFRIEDKRIKKDLNSVMVELENYITQEYSTPRPSDTPLPEGNTTPAPPEEGNFSLQA